MKRIVFHILITLCFVGVNITNAQRNTETIDLKKIAVYDLGEGITTGAGFFKDDLLYIPSETGIKIIDILKPEKPKLVKIIGTENPIRDVLTASDYIYAVGRDGLFIYNEKTTELIFGYNLPFAKNIAVRNDTIYIGTTGTKIFIFGLTERNKIKAIGEYDTKAYLGDLKFFGKYLFAATWNGLLVLETGLKDSLKLVWEYAIPYFSRIEWDKEKVNVTSFYDGNYTFDISELNNPKFIKQTKGRGMSVAVVADENKWLFIDSQGARIISQTDTSETIEGSYGNGEYYFFNGQIRQNYVILAGRKEIVTLEIERR